MRSSSKISVKSLLKRYGLKPNKRLGQNFLVDRSIIRKIIAAADLKPQDIVLEIGPGLGALTLELAKRTKQVVAVEKDPGLVNILNRELKENNIKIIQGDILKTPNNKIPYKVIGNLPFYLTAPAIRKMLESEGSRPQRLVLVVQKEVAQRICAKPPDMSLLAVSVQFYSKPKIVSYISKKAFWPQPEVDAAIIKIRVKKRKNNEELFFKIVRAGFSRPRKQLANNLSKFLDIDRIKAGEWLRRNKIQPNQRAETLNIKDWIRLTENLNEI